MDVKGAIHPASLDVGQTLGQPGIDGAPLLWGVLVVGRKKFRAVDHLPGGDDNFATLESEVDQITLGQAGLALYAGGNDDLAFVLDFPYGVHKNVETNFLDNREF